MMHHAVTKRSGFYNSLLGISNDELAVAAMFICFMRQFPTQREQVFLKFVAEFQNGTAVALALARISIRVVKIGKRSDLFK